MTARTATLLVMFFWCLGISCARRGAPAGPSTARTPTVQSPVAAAAPGKTLFLRNCAHCHGADARGSEGPDLHHLDWSDEQIAARIRQGKKGQMPAFGAKLQEREIGALLQYLSGLDRAEPAPGAAVLTTPAFAPM